MIRSASYRYSGVVLAICLALMLGACASLNPYAYAKTTLDKAHVTLRSMEITQEGILTLVRDASIQESVKSPLRAASRAGTIAAEELGKATLELEQALADLRAGTTTSEKVAIANARLVQWTNTVLARIKSIEAAAKEIRR